MKKLTGTSLILALALFFGAQSAMATLDNQDMAFAFGAESSTDMAMLSEKEMVETEGAVFLGGAVTGLGVYTVSTGIESWDGSIGSSLVNFTDNFSTSDALWATASGAVGGAYGQALFRGVGYTGFAAQATAPVFTQVHIRGGAFGAGFSTFGVHGAATTSFNNGLSSMNNSSNFGRDFGSYCGSCYRAGQ